MNSVIWIKVTVTRGDNFLLQSTYRPWRVIDNKHTESVKSQLSRWKHQIQKWKEANLTGEVITVGDINLNAMDWNKNQSEHSKHDK